MPFTKGNRYGTGRPPKAGNKVLQSTREAIKTILDKTFTPEKIIDDLESLKPVDRLNLLVKLIEYQVPRMRSLEVGLEGLSDEQCSFILMELQKKFIESEFKGRIANE